MSFSLPSNYNQVISAAKRDLEQLKQGKLNSSSSETETETQTPTGQGNPPVGSNPLDDIFPETATHDPYQQLQQLKVMLTFLDPDAPETIALSTQIAALEAQLAPPPPQNPYAAMVQQWMNWMWQSLTGWLPGW